MDWSVGALGDAIVCSAAATAGDVLGDDDEGGGERDGSKRAADDGDGAETNPVVVVVLDDDDDDDEEDEEDFFVLRVALLPIGVVAVEAGAPGILPFFLDVGVVEGFDDVAGAGAGAVILLFDDCFGDDLAL
jgi:hypothetical protein